MSKRAKTYLVVLAVKSVLFALSFWFGPALLPQLMVTSSWLMMWDNLVGVIFAGVAGAAVWGTIKGNSDVARWALLGSAVVSSIWFASLFAVLIQGGVVFLGYLIVLGAAVAKDLTMLSNPLQTPFEDLLTHMVDDGQLARTESAVQEAKRDLAGS